VSFLARTTWIFSPKQFLVKSQTLIFSFNQFLVEKHTISNIFRLKRQLRGSLNTLEDKKKVIEISECEGIPTCAAKKFKMPPGTAY